MSDELTLKAISTYNGNLHNGLTTALEAVVAMVLEEAARVVPTTWLDPLLTGPGATELPLDGPGVEKLCRGITAAIRALKDTPT